MLIAQRLEFVRPTAPMRPVVCVSKTAPLSKTLCAPPLEKHMTTDAGTSQATVRDWKTVLSTTQAVVRVSKNIN